MRPTRRAIGLWSVPSTRGPRRPLSRALPFAFSSLAGVLLNLRTAPAGRRPPLQQVAYLVDPRPLRMRCRRFACRTEMPDKLALAVGAPGNTFSDHGMRW